MHGVVVLVLVLVLVIGEYGHCMCVCMYSCIRIWREDEEIIDRRSSPC